jgi:hypothetical protein
MTTYCSVGIGEEEEEEEEHIQKEISPYLHRQKNGCLFEFIILR